ncbi:membrane-spanning 4-domains subfamily A member 18 [Bos mutus]|nr:PREDICTED: membrane-spanning 4-domains subfamily A member 18 [Bos mutus]ELR51139.1 Membrane-spanning 4-domains subfamily A member 18 [Bos mutus]
MMEQGVGANTVPGVTAPGNVYMIQARNPVAPGSKGQPVGMATYLTSRVTESDAGRANLQTPRVVIQNPAEVNATQGPPTALQHPTAVASLQTPPGEIQYSLGTTDLQTQPGGPQNPPTCAPGPMYTSNQFQWNMPFGSSFTFDPKKFIKDEVRTLGAIQILIGLTHIFTAINPSLYHQYSYPAISGYLVWGGIFFIISGSLSVEAEKDHSSCMVHGSIGMNVVSAIVSLAGVLLLVVDLIFNLATDVKTISGGLLPFVLLEFCLTCVVSHFGCQATCWNQFVNRTEVPTVVIANPANTPTGPFNATYSTTGHVNVITSSANPTSPTNAAVMVPPVPS